LGARDCYEGGWVTAKDFAGHTVDEINAMTSFDVRDFYQKEFIVLVILVDTKVMLVQVKMYLV
jgi:hypothetical protein